MSSWWVNFHFLRPWWLLLLLIPLFFYRRYIAGRRNQSSWENVCDKKLLPFLLVKGSSAQRKILSWLALVGVISAIIAAAGPSWNKVEIPALAPENPVMIVLNLSSEMSKTDLSPTRLERAKFKIKDFLSLLKGVQAGLIVYTQEPFLISPLTEDTEIIANLLPAVNFDIMPLNGDRLDRAIDLAVAKLRAAGFKQGEIVVFAPDAGQKFDEALKAATKARQQHFKVSIAAVNAQANEKLQMIAQAGGGEYWNLQFGDTELQNLASRIIGHSSTLSAGQNWQSVWLDYGYYLLTLPLLCCLYFFRRGIVVVAFLLLTAQPSRAGFFHNADQEGFNAFQQQDFQRAAEKFSSPVWQAAAAYRMGDYDKAYQKYALEQDVESLYNQGNALAKGGKIADAIKKYEEVLQQNPDHEDAKFNLEYLKQQQQQNQQSSSSDNNSETSDQGQDENSSQPQDNQSSGQDKPQNNGQDNSGDNENQSEQAANGQDEPDGQNQTPQADRSEPQPTKVQDYNGQSPQQTQAAETQNADNQAASAAPKSFDDESEYDEEAQARAQQYREIPEDVGGLLRAFIYKEYKSKRYQD